MGSENTEAAYRVAAFQTFFSGRISTFGDNHRSRAYVTVTFAVTVRVDPTNDELLDRFDESSGPFSVTNIVANEIESNLESVSYVHDVSVQPVTGDESHAHRQNHTQRQR
jgi:hypothetical protein